MVVLYLQGIKLLGPSYSMNMHDFGKTSPPRPGSQANSKKQDSFHVTLWKGDEKLKLEDFVDSHT